MLKRSWVCICFAILLCGCPFLNPLEGEAVDGEENQEAEVPAEGEGEAEGEAGEPEARQAMRDFVIAISEYARAAMPDFWVIPQNGQELLTTDGDPEGPAASAYVAAVHGQGREDLFYGYEEDNEATPEGEREYMVDFMARAEALGVRALVTDYCWTPWKMDDSYFQNREHGFLSFAANSRDLDEIPPYPARPVNTNSRDIVSLQEARNFLYLLDPGGFSSKQAYLNALAATSHDVIIMDMFYDDVALGAQDLAQIRTKGEGGSRLLVAYMSVGEAEDYRYYWQADWGVGDPAWLRAENPNWDGNYKVEYWDPAWQAVIFGSDAAYLDRILATGFDGVYLDIIDAFEYFEDQ